jgi:hypothetical protein
MKPILKTLCLQTLVATSFSALSAFAIAAPVSILESVACAGDANGDENTPCFVLPGISAFTFLGELTAEPNNNFDLSDFLQFAGLLNNVAYDYTFSQTGDSLFGFTYDADSVLEVFDAANPIGTAFADAGGNIYAGVFLDDSASNAGAYSLTFSPVPAPATAALLSMGILMGASSRRKPS